MKLRLWILLVIGLLALGVFPAAAQENADEHFAEINCLGLSEADCAIVQATGDDFHSFNMEFSFDYSTGNTDDLAIPGLSDSVSASGNGTVAVDEAMMSEDNPMAGISVAFDMSGTYTNADGPNSLDTSFVLVDGNIYVFQPFTGEYRGTALSDLMEHFSSMPGMTFMGMPVPMDQMMEMGHNGMMEDGEGMAEMMGDFDPMELVNMPGFLSQTRDADETLDGQTMYSFTYTADLAVLLTNEDVQNMFSEMTAQMTTGTDNPMAAQMGTMMPVILQNTSGTVTLTRWIGADDQFIHRVVFDVQAAIDLFGGGSTDSTPIPPITLSLTADVTLRDINSAEAPSAPEGATLVPAEEFLGIPEMTPEATPES